MSNFYNHEEKILLAEKLRKINQFRQPLELEALAAAYDETGQFNEDLLTAKKAHKMALIQNTGSLAQGLKQ